jgi:membrane-bound lytic murein transglycosylase D
VIGHFPEHYGFQVVPEKPIAFDTVTVSDCLPLDVAGKAVGASFQTLKELNPELAKWCTPPNKKNWVLRIPQGTREQFVKAYAKMDKSKFARFQHYRVRSGDVLGKIANHYGLSVKAIQQANNLRTTRIYPGQQLLIPMPASYLPKETASASKNSNKSSVKNSSQSATKTTASKQTKTVENKQESSARTYRVRRGDNFTTIARKHGISVQNLKDWNDRPDGSINYGERIFVQNPKTASQKKPTASAQPATQKKSEKKSDSQASVQPGIYYIVQDGDNGWDISRRYNVTLEQLKEWNPQVNIRNLFPGMRIKVGE